MHGAGEKCTFHLKTIIFGVPEADSHEAGVLVQHPPKCMVFIKLMYI
jgi:hypothetical protein